MKFCALKYLARALGISLISCMCAHAQCSVKVVVVKGRAVHVPSNAWIRVQLLYPKRHPGESGETTVENGKFTIPIEFLTEGRRSFFENLPTKCNRKPQTVVIALGTRDQTYDSVSLNFAKDFKMADTGAYALRSELTLTGPE